MIFSTAGKYCAGCAHTPVEAGVSPAIRQKCGRKTSLSPYLAPERERKLLGYENGERAEGEPDQDEDGKGAARYLPIKASGLCFDCVFSRIVSDCCGGVHSLLKLVTKA